jgi:hypothetical protein
VTRQNSGELFVTLWLDLLPHRELNITAQAAPTRDKFVSPVLLAMTANPVVPAAKLRFDAMTFHAPPEMVWLTE